MASTSKRRRITEENRGFNPAWTESFAFIANAAGLPECLICGERIATVKKCNVERHFQKKHAEFARKYQAGDERERAVSELLQKKEQKTSPFKKWVKCPDLTAAATVVAAEEIVSRGKPFTDADYLKETLIKMSEHLFSDFQNKAEIMQRIKDMPLSAATVTDRTVRMAAEVTSCQIKDINSAPAYSIACHALINSKDTEQLALLCRYVNSDGPQEEIIDLIPLQGTTRGEDICEAVLNCLKAKEISTSHMVSVATDGSPSMRETQKGFVTSLQKSLDHELLTFHFILHQEALCAQMFPPECTEVMNLVIQLINEIIAKGFNHRQFRALLDEVDSTYSERLLRNKVRWLSRGEVLKRFAACLEHVKSFLQSRGLDYPELEDPAWLEKLHFMADMTTHLNVLYRNLQEKGRTALQMLEDVVAFERKLTLFATDLQSGTFSHFPSLREFKDRDSPINCEYLHYSILVMKIAFGQRFTEFQKEKATLSFPVTPLDVDPSMLNVSAFSGVSIPDLELELADIADRDLWVSKFRRLKTQLEDVACQKASLARDQKWAEIEQLPKPDKLVFDAWSSIPVTYMNMKRCAFGVLSIFGSTYLCEKVFSNMNYIKSKFRSRLTDESLQSFVKMKVTSYCPDIDNL